MIKLTTTKKNKKPSKTKPDIKKGITRIDLQHWYLREEMQEWLKSHDLPSTGKKAQLANKIYNYLSNDVVM